MHCFCNKELIKQFKKPWISDVFQNGPLLLNIYLFQQIILLLDIPWETDWEKMKMDQEKEVKRNTKTWEGKKGSFTQKH